MSKLWPLIKLFKSLYLIMYIKEFIKLNLKNFVDLCHEHSVNKIYAFGSSINNKFDLKNSDIDLVVDISIEEPADRGEALISLWDKLELLFGRKIDLLTENSINNPYLKINIDRTKTLIYDREREEVLI